MKRAILAAAVLVSLPAQADTFLDINGFSQHSLPYYNYAGERHRFNESNAGLGITHEVYNNLEAKAGFYDNSYNKESLYIAANFKLPWVVREITLSPSIAVGLVSGYNNTPMHSGMLQPYVMPNFQIRYKHAGMLLGYIPGAESGKNEVPVSVVTLQFQYKL